MRSSLPTSWSPDRIASIALALALASAACSSGAPSASASVRGMPDDLQLLIGTWVGEFLDPATGESGTMHFTLDAGLELDTGEVILHPTADRPELMVLAIRQVALDRRGQVAVLARAVFDPQCKCELRIELSGTLDGDRMSGEYTRIRRRDVRQGGRWSMTRK